MRKSLIYIIILLFLPSLCLAIAQDDDKQTDIQPTPSSTDSVMADTAVVTDPIVPADTVARLSDRTIIPASTADSMPPRRSRIVREKVDLETAVEFSSSDSMIIVRRDSAFMFGESSVSY